MSTHNLCFEQKYKKYQSFFYLLSENFQFLEVKFSIYLNRHDFVMCSRFHRRMVWLRSACTSAQPYLNLSFFQSNSTAFKK